MQGKFFTIRDRDKCVVGLKSTQGSVPAAAFKVYKYTPKSSPNGLRRQRSHSTALRDREANNATPEYCYKLYQVSPSELASPASVSFASHTV